METLLGDEFGDVRVHGDPAAAEAASELQADAFTAGRDIYFATGRDTFDTPEGAALLGHELTHVRQGRERGPSQGTPGGLQEQAEEWEALTSEATVRRFLEGDVLPSPGWARPAMDLPALGPRAGDAARGDSLRGAGHAPSTRVGPTPAGVARAVATRTTQTAQAPTEGTDATQQTETTGTAEQESVDLDALAHQVYEMIMRRLTLERERLGYR